MGVVLTLGSELKKAILEAARNQGVAPEVLAMDALRDRFLATGEVLVPRDEWERHLLGSASDCGVSLPPSSLSSDGLYD